MVIMYLFNVLLLQFATFSAFFNPNSREWRITELSYSDLEIAKREYHIPCSLFVIDDLRFRGVKENEVLFYYFLPSIHSLYRVYSCLVFKREIMELHCKLLSRMRIVYSIPIISIKIMRWDTVGDKRGENRGRRWTIWEWNWLIRQLCVRYIRTGDCTCHSVHCLYSHDKIGSIVHTRKISSDNSIR